MVTPCSSHPLDNSSASLAVRPPTNTTFLKKVTYTVQYQPKYEPYVAVRVPVGSARSWFDARFVGYGYNKMVFVAFLSALGYTFHVCRFGYVLSKYHLPSKDSYLMRKNVEERIQKRRLYDQALQEMEELREE